MSYCWFEPKGGYTCMLPEGHDGPHKPTSDDDILISLAPSEDPALINLTVYDPPEAAYDL